MKALGDSITRLGDSITRLDLFVDWPEKYFSGQSAGWISTTSGTRLVKKKVPRGSSALEVNFRAENIAARKYRIVPTISPWVSEDASHCNIINSISFVLFCLNFVSLVCLMLFLFVF